MEVDRGLPQNLLATVIIGGGRVSGVVPLSINRYQFSGFLCRVL